MHFLIYGDNTHASRKRLTSMRTRFSDTRDTSGLNVTTLHAKKTDLDTVAQHLFASPFLAEKKMLILEGFLGKPAAEQKTIQGYLERKPDSTVVVFFEEAGKTAFKKSALFKLLEKQKFTSDHPKMSGTQVITHIKKTCKEAGLEVSPRAVQMFSASIVDDPWRLDTELGKVITYAQALDKKLVDEEMVHLLVSGSQDEPIFAYIDACLEGRGGDATRFLEGLRSNGMSDIQVVSMLLKQFRTLIAVRDLTDRGERNKAAIATRLGIHPFPAGKAMVTAKRFSPEVLKKLHTQLLKIDREFKRTSGKHEVLLNIFTARVSAIR